MTPTWTRILKTALALTIMGGASAFPTPLVRAAPGLSAQAAGSDATRIDYLTFAQGALFVGQTGLASGSSGTALLAIDGDPYRMSLTTDRNGPVEFIFKLPANTTFDRFAIPAVVEQPGNVTFVKNVEVSGSVEGPESGYRVLATFELETHATDEEVTEVVPAVVTPVRWIRLRLEGGINIEPGDEGRTALWFSEIIGNGVQDPSPTSTAFAGVFDLRSTERPDLPGQPIWLAQESATVTGCYDGIRFFGSVNGSIARASGEDSDGERPSHFIFVADDDGAIHTSMSINRGRFTARSAISDPDTQPPPCAETPPVQSICGADVYVNFEYDSATILPESEPVLADLFWYLTTEGIGSVKITGHTSTEGSAEYNQSLSERRAQAVADDLVARGFERAYVSAAGEGETDPLVSPDRDAASRSLNRRVTITCS